MNHIFFKPLPGIEGLEKINIEIDHVFLELSKKILKLIAKGLNLEVSHVVKMSLLLNVTPILD